MQKLFVSLCLGLIASTQALGQTAATSSVQVTCELPSNCTTRLVNGKAVLSLRGPEASLDVSLVYTKRFLRADLAVTNTSGRDLDVVPLRFQLSQPPSDKTATALPLSAVLKKEGQRDKTWANFFDMEPAATKQETVVMVKHVEQSDAYSHSDEIKKVNVTVPDEERRAAARARIADRKERLRSDLETMQQSYLQANTLSPGITLRGSVYFPTVSAAGSYVLLIPLGSRTYRFTLPADQE